MFLSSNTIDTIKNLVLENKVEVCGHLLTQDEQEKYGIPISKNRDELVLYIDNVGEQSFCLPTMYTKYTWHTHSRVSKGYPSVQDIFLPLRKTPKISCIFTIWGIWQVNARNSRYLPLYNRKNPDQRIEQLLGQIYHSTQKGRSIYLSKDERRIVNNLLREINHILSRFDMVIYFTDWREIEGNYVLL